MKPGQSAESTRAKRADLRTISVLRSPGLALEGTENVLSKQRETHFAENDFFLSELKPLPGEKALEEKTRRGAV